MIGLERVENLKDANSNMNINMKGVEYVDALFFTLTGKR